jgi:hypothetical protein
VLRISEAGSATLPEELRYFVVVEIALHRCGGRRPDNAENRQFDPGPGICAPQLSMRRPNQTILLLPDALPSRDDSAVIRGSAMPLYHWARVAVQRDPRSRAKYAALRQRGHSHARAVRSLGDRLLNVA